MCVDAVSCMFLSFLALRACLRLHLPLAPVLFSYVAGSSTWTWCGGTVGSVSGSLNFTLRAGPRLSALVFMLLDCLVVVSFNVAGASTLRDGAAWLSCLMMPVRRLVRS
jgi:hypothetical protein